MHAKKFSFIILSAHLFYLCHAHLETMPSITQQSEKKCMEESQGARCAAGPLSSGL